jgi:hypothetical protein
MNAEVSEIYDFLRSFSGSYVSVKDICRGLGKESRHPRDRHQVLPNLQRMEQDGLVEANSLGEYRAKGAGTTTFRQALPSRNLFLGDTTIINYAKSQEAVDHPHGNKWEAQLIELNRVLGIVQRTKNAVALRRLIADDYQGISARGAVHTKEDTIARFMSGELVLLSVCSEEVEVRIFGTAGVVTGRTLAEGTLSGREFRSRVRFTDVWALRQGSWALVTSQATPEDQRSESTFHSFIRRGSS